MASVPLKVVNMSLSSSWDLCIHKQAAFSEGYSCFSLKVDLFKISKKSLYRKFLRGGWTLCYYYSFVLRLLLLLSSSSVHLITICYIVELIFPVKLQKMFSETDGFCIVRLLLYIKKYVHGRNPSL